MNIKNPIGITNIGDPFVFKYENKYYLYATSFVDGFNCWISDDFVKWSEPVQVYRKNKRSFGYKDFGPEVIYHDGKFIMHYTARWNKNDSLRIGVAISNSPTGPFIDVYFQQPMFDDGFAVIDGHVFIDDDDGKRYFYYDRDCSEYIYHGNHESHIFVVEIDETFTKRISEPKLVSKPEQDWEMITGDWRWNEGPFVFKHEDIYYLMFSSGFYASETYSIGYATSHHPTGPFVKASENPILKTIPNKVSGPGHNSIVLGPDQHLYCVYHVHTNYHEPSANRQVFMDKISFNRGKLVIEGPTLSEDNQDE